MPRKRLTTITEADQFSNRDLLLDMALKLHEMDKKLDAHLTAHRVLAKAGLVAISLAGVVAAWIRLR